jgi:sister-chromatid-cohesion protein PDS5
MPRATRRRASSPAQVEEEEEEEVDEQEPEHGDDRLARLKFSKPVTWKAGKPLAVAELHKRLADLAEELQKYDQDEVAKDSMLKVAGELASQQLVSHKDRGVKAYTACCLVDIFRLCAPDAPYTAPQLKVGHSRLMLEYALTNHRTSSPSSCTQSSLPSPTHPAPTTPNTFTSSNPLPK